MAVPKVSICIPVYNGEPYIREAIDSALGQTFEDFEIVIVDNQSTDNTVAIIHSYTDKRIRFLQNEKNIGMVANWDRVVKEARGEYIKILPADDLLYPECLKKQVEILDGDTSKRISMVCARRHIINPNGKVLFSRGFSNRRTEVSGTAAINKNMRSGGNIIGESGSVLFRKELLEKTGGFASQAVYVNDLFLWYKILMHGNLYSLPDILSAFRLSTASESIHIRHRQKKDLDVFNRMILEDGRYKINKLSYYFGRMNNYFATQARKVIYSLLQLRER